MNEFASDRQALADRLARRESLHDEVKDAIASVPRHEFVPESRQHRAYRDMPLPIGADQTISAPHIVARMTEDLDVDEGDDVLEIGTGCGYHAAVTAEVVGAEHVYSVEYEESLATEARETLDRLGYGGISVRIGDGHEGWPDHAQYDAAYLTCAAAAFPDAVVDQVRTGGTLLGPIGQRRQYLVNATKREDGGLDEDRGVAVRFVPLRGGGD